MRHTIRTTLLLSATALFSAACTNMPMEGQDTSYNTNYTGYNAPTAATTTSNPVPEAGPLSESAPAVNAQAATYNAPAAAANPVPVATAPQNVPVATVPQVPNATHTVANANNNHNNGYDVYAANTTAAPANTYTGSNNAGGNHYTNTGNTGYVNTVANASGSAAVQVFATGSQAKAQRISQDMRSQGLPAVVDLVNGLYKVRIPYPDTGAARANLIRVRQASGEAGAFVTTR